MTSIEWTDCTWNPVRGCSRVSEGCRNCYAERTAARFSGGDIGDDSEDRLHGAFEGFAIMKSDGPHWTGKVELIESKLEEPLHWKKPRRVFVNSMSDLFHESLPDDAIDRVVHVMAWASLHTYQILTKRHERLMEYSQTMAALNPQQRAARIIGSSFGRPVHMDPQDNGGLEWPLPNVWLGVSVEDQKTADERIPLLLQTPAAIRFVSYEPALGPVCLLNYLLYGPWSAVNVKPPTSRGLDWVICGGESGPGARPFDIAWARSVRDQCKAAGGGVLHEATGRAPVHSGLRGQLASHQRALAAQQNTVGRITRICRLVFAERRINGRVARRSTHSRIPGGPLVPLQRTPARV